MEEIEQLENGKLVFHSYEALKAYCDDVNNPLDKVVLGKEIDSLERLFEDSNRTNEQFKGIEGWDVSNVEDMDSMFASAYAFNQPLNSWDVSKVNNMSGMFYFAEGFNQPLNNWNVSKVKNMAGMFAGAEKFNQPLNNWDVSNVTNMYSMFHNAENFNQPLNNWDVSNVKNTEWMFYQAKVFNQSLSSWGIENYEEVGLPADYEVEDLKTEEVEKTKKSGFHR